jgi:hypothetical protein
MGFLGCVTGGAEVGLEPKFDFGGARSTLVRDRPRLTYRKIGGGQSETGPEINFKLRR